MSDGRHDTTRIDGNNISSRPLRIKPIGTVKQNKYKKVKEYCRVTCKLNSICKDPLLRDEIRRSVREMQQIRMEAWHLVNLHTLRCLEEAIPLPDYTDKTFYDHCCSCIATTAKTNLIARKNPELWESYRVYKEKRALVGLEEVRNRVGYFHLKAELRKQIVVNAGVMIRQHFAKRLRLYVQIAFGGLGSNLDNKEKKKKSTPYVVEALQIRDALTLCGVEWSEQWIPGPNRIGENGLAFYVRLIWEFQDVVEKRMKAEPNEKGVRAFSLFPVSTTYTASHTKINGTTVAGFYLRIKKREKKFCWQIPGVEVSTESFQQNRWVVMRNAFDISRIETRSPLCPLPNPEFASLPVEEKYKHASHLFANQVTMDGYGTSLLLFGPRQRKMTRRGRKRGLLSTPSSPLGTCRTPSLDWIQGCKPFVRPSQKIYALIGKDTVDNEDADPGVVRRHLDHIEGRVITRTGYVHPRLLSVNATEM
ncbi:hypothetical protein F441_05500 [Phytophthora nicotianae CJ01A1]|uniref:Uncharacterized protein n=1 Tax=Phytophthora nicotianae CJ01A1 TaxID=1317063 RepID=W2XER3_PHYNI|nr:hypothetical protein F441_05500 [Phytophthora nicotianae CJ01A1]